MDDILIVDDNPHIRDLIAEILGDNGYSTRSAATSTECMNAFRKAQPSMVLLDIWLHDLVMDGLDVMRELRKRNPSTPIVIMSAHGTIEVAVRAMRQGAFDYIEKPISLDRLLSVVKNAMELVKLRRKINVLQLGGERNAHLIGESDVSRKLRERVDRVADTNMHVLLVGPHGSGKETAARYAHARSRHASGPFVTASFSASGPERIESRLYGRAYDDQAPIPGYLEMAHGGTLFLKEVSHIPLMHQEGLARAIARGQIRPVDGSGDIKIRFRVISSSSSSLEIATAEQRFSPALLHRLNTTTIEVPPLDMRRDDIPELAAFFLRELHESQGFPLRQLTSDAETFLSESDWPGNVKQLRNSIERALIVGESDEPITVSDIQSAVSSNAADTSFTLDRRYIGMKLRDARETFERQYFIAQINRHGGNISKAAEFVGMERAAMHRKIKALGIVTIRDSYGSRAMLQSEGETE
ncbi:MAG: sigma-54 dependent transcriptional regulator [Rhodobacteraceae bacterium]|nr:sigma-54 dependent transcriptional regulator [Paracoccaceae bacterium]